MFIYHQSNDNAHTVSGSHITNFRYIRSMNGHVLLVIITSNYVGQSWWHNDTHRFIQQHRDSDIVTVLFVSKKKIEFVSPNK